MLSEVELRSREEIQYENYAKVLNIEAQTMVVMASRQIIPAVEGYIEQLARTAKGKMDILGSLECAEMERELVTRLSELNTKAYRAVNSLKKADAEAAAMKPAKAAAFAFRDAVLPVMRELRAAVDEMETLVSSEYWPLPTYGEMTYKQ